MLTTPTLCACGCGQDTNGRKYFNDACKSRYKYALKKAANENKVFLCIDCGKEKGKNDNLRCVSCGIKKSRSFSDREYTREPSLNNFKKCDTCIHAIKSTRSEDGYECGKEVYLACKPGLIPTPKFYEEKKYARS